MRGGCYISLEAQHCSGLRSPNKLKQGELKHVVYPKIARYEIVYVLRSNLQDASHRGSKCDQGRGSALFDGGELFKPLSVHAVLRANVPLYA